MRCGNQYRICWNLIKLSKTIHHLAFELHIAPSKIEKNFALWCNADRAVRAVKSTDTRMYFSLDDAKKVNVLAAYILYDSTIIS